MLKPVGQKRGNFADGVFKELTKLEIKHTLTRETLKISDTGDRFTNFALFDALTRIARTLTKAGDRIEVDRQADGLLALAQ